MRSFAVLLALASLVVATQSLVDNAQTPLGSVSSQVPGFTLDLAEMRLVQVEGQEPAWVSELEKVQKLISWSMEISNASADQHEGPRPQLLRHVRRCQQLPFERVC